MQVKRLAWLGTRTERFDETTAFFRDVLGIPMFNEEPGFGMLQLPSGDRDFVEVFAPDNPSAALYSTGPVVGLLVDDIDQARVELDTGREHLRDHAGLAPADWLDADDLDGPAPIALAIELEEEHALPLPELELATPHRNRLSGRAQEHRHTVGVAVRGLNVLGTDVFRAAVPIVVGVVVLGGDEPPEEHGEVLEESALPLVHPYGAGRMRRVDAADAVADRALVDSLLHLVRDVRDGQPAGGAKVRFVLERLHGRVTLCQERPSHRRRTRYGRAWRYAARPEGP